MQKGWVTTLLKVHLPTWICFDIVQNRLKISFYLLSFYINRDPMEEIMQAYSYFRPTAGRTLHYSNFRGRDEQLSSGESTVFGSLLLISIWWLRF